MGLGNRVLEKFGQENEEGDLILPKDCGSCYYCGYIGLGWINYKCPKCNKLSVTYQKVQENKRECSNKVRTDWADKNIKKQISEIWVATKYRDEGYKVIQVGNFSFSCNKIIPNDEGISNFLKDYKDKKKIIDLIKSYWNGFPDLILLKDNKVSFAEVKSNNSSIKENQKKVLDFLKEKGYDVFVEQVKLNYSVENSRRIELEQLEEKKDFSEETYFKVKD